MENRQNPLNALSADVFVVGAGLAGCECAWQLATRGLRVALIEQRPLASSPAHKTNLFAELVCSNSLKSEDPLSAPGLLKSELLELNSLILRSAHQHKVPAGQALAVERNGFSSKITETLKAHPKIQVIHYEVQNYQELFDTIDRQTKPAVLATGPLGSHSLMKSLEDLIGDQLYFYDAISPIIDGSTINLDKTYKKNRYDKESSSGSDDDYINCPLSKEEYFSFIKTLEEAEKVESHSFEKIPYFQGCQPIEAMVEKGPMTLAFGPMKPMGLEHPETGLRPFAVVQLRKEDTEGRAWNMVGFQTKMKYPDQKRVFKKIPGLENAEFFRFGSIHRNSYLKSPAILNEHFAMKNFPQLYFAGQITGVEGYLESTAIGAYVGISLAQRILNGEPPPPPPSTTALGALIEACYKGSIKNFQPMNINWGLVPLNGIDPRDHEKKNKLTSRARRTFNLWKDLIIST